MNKHCLEQDIIKIFQLQSKTKQPKKTWDLHITQKEKQQMMLALKIVHLSFFRRRMCSLMGKLALLGNRNNPMKLCYIIYYLMNSYQWTQLFWRVPPHCCAPACITYHKMGKYIRYFKSRFSKQSSLYIFRSCSLHGMISLFKQT